MDNELKPCASPEICQRLGECCCRPEPPRREAELVVIEAAKLQVMALFCTNPVPSDEQMQAATQGLVDAVGELNRLTPVPSVDKPAKKKP
jgi:hypothetical protein